MQSNEHNEEKVLSTESTGESFEQVASKGLSRRRMLKVVAAAGAAAVAAPMIAPTNKAAAAPGAPAQAVKSGVTPARSVAQAGSPFTPLSASIDAVRVPEGYTAQTLLRWGDPLTPDAPEFDKFNLTGDAQEMQFGYNCDFVGFQPLPLGSDSSDRGLLIVNHEYTNEELMFADYDPEALTQEMVDVAISAHGLSVVEIAKNADGDWEVVLDSEFNRRISARTTPMELTGPVAGNALVQTSEDSTGLNVIGTLNNCAGGKTPWGTILTAEENFHQYFGNADLVEDEDILAIHQRYGLPAEASDRRWEDFYPRFDLSQEPNEPFRFGWVVEVDPYDPESTPKKRTAMGRFRHEAATVVITPDNSVVIYSGDDARFEYVYKFVSDGTYDPGDREANLDLMENGTLYVARFDGQLGDNEGTGEWIPLIYGEGPLTEENGFTSQADVLINTRAAADLLGATTMDRPEDIETNPVTGAVYMAMTKNDRRLAEGESEDDPSVEVNAANPRPDNIHGHVIEVLEDGNDHTSTTFTWNIFLLCGHPSDPSTYYGGFEMRDMVSPISSPDNVTFDRLGNLWISTDGQPSALGINDALHFVPVEGENRGQLQQFFESVPGSEVCGPEFTADDTALFLAIQHPGEGGTFSDPKSFWPDNEAPPRPSVVAVRKVDGTSIV